LHLSHFSEIWNRLEINITEAERLTSETEHGASFKQMLNF